MVRPKPYVFDTRDELIAKLRAPAISAHARLLFAADAESLAGAVDAGVAGNTFRAFRKPPVKPSVTFRHWATSHLTRRINAVARLAATNDVSGYARFRHRATHALCLEWHQRTGTDIGYGRAAKLFNLVMKRIVSAHLRSAERSPDPSLACAA